jgi:hypothetical protein
MTRCAAVRVGVYQHSAVGRDVLVKIFIAPRRGSDAARAFGKIYSRGHGSDPSRRTWTWRT